MTNVRMISNYAGPNGSCQSGGIILLDDDEAKQLIDGGYAEYVVEESAAEDAQEESNSDDESDPDLPDDLKKLKGGYYQLPNGEKVRGKEKALAAYEALKEQQ